DRWHRPARLADRPAADVATRRLPVLDGSRAVRRQVARLQARARRPEVLDGSAAQAVSTADHQAHRRPPRTRADEPAPPALLDDHTLQPAARRLPRQHRPGTTY